MNSFDAVVYLVALVAVISGFNAGLLRSIATIMGYLTALPVAMAAMPYASRSLLDKRDAAGPQSSLILFGIFLVVGMALSALLRTAISEIIGSRIHMQY